MPTALFPSPKFSKSKVDWAGRILCDDSADAIDVAAANFIIDDWRAAHRRPLTHMNVHLRNLAKEVRRNPVIAQRLKRTPSIRHKLERLSTMRLSKMQDIGGCRIVLSNMR
jgi:putative GTP pyrophosphokinase